MRTYPRIRRGAMAADRFTQISNDLFRDPRLSFKAKGVFGLISTHRDGFGITPQRLAEQSTDGLAAIKTGLRELEAYGYLFRRQERRPDGTLGAFEYLITDTPDRPSPSSEPVTENPPPAPTSQNKQNRRSGPVVDYPPAAGPPAADQPPKNTNTKNTSGKNTNPTSPHLPPAQDPGRNAAGNSGRAGAETITPEQPQRHSPQAHGTPGQDLLWTVADAVAGLTLTGTTVRRLGDKVDELLGRGWTRTRILTALTADTEELTHPRGALAWRIEDLLQTPTPQNAEAAAAPSRPADRGVHRECPGDDGLCGRPLTVGESLCHRCVAR
ncbi:hypothetical protein [Streptacidiphilus anmyonensis]|uniref:hypothetical protein n=1 Tax=Streptacidiphilus anmyonensis TaxID=405782 RepID=UPI001F1E1413|nr:hypothetical protein [Streptacidiphilus anmyonensis]